MSKDNKVGKRIAKYREKLGLTQEQLSVSSGLSLEDIKAIEEGRMYPPISQMVRLSRALGQRIGTFMDDQFVPDPIVVKESERKEETGEEGAKGHYHLFMLGKNKTDRHMEPMFIKMHVDEVKEMTSHEGEEFIIVTKGKVLLKYGNEEKILSEGDSAYYNSVVPHYTGAIDGPAEIYAVLYVPI